MKKFLLRLLNDQRTFWVLLFIASCSCFATFWYGHIIGFSDEGHYWSLAEGLHHGKFSAWYFLPIDTPETLRTWGYPFFLYLCQFFSPTYTFVHFVQLALFGISIYCILKLIKHFYQPLAYRSLFLLFLVFNNHLSFYSGVLIAECLCIFFVTLFATIYILKKDSYVKYLLLALVCFALYQLRPIFMIFPVFLVGYSLLFNRKNLRYHLLLFVVFLFTLIPFGLWNKANHGVFKVTPLEGGYGVALQGGYWEYRLPLGFKAPYYWGMNVDDDLLQPEFTTAAEREEGARQYVKDWDEMEATLKKTYTVNDSLREVYESDPAYAYRRNFRIYSTKYTMDREQMLKEKFITYVKEHPYFYFKTRVYVFFRQWVTGINGTQLKEAKSIKGYVVALYPFLVTFFFILVGLFIICISLLRKKLSFKKYHILFLFMGYLAVADIPFGVMSRYTVPVHLFILMLLSIIFMNALYKPKIPLPAG